MPLARFGGTLAALAALGAASVCVWGGNAAAASPRIAFARHDNVFLMDQNGKNIRTVTTRGTGFQGIYYPWYQWSPDRVNICCWCATSRKANTTGSRNC